MRRNLLPSLIAAASFLGMCSCVLAQDPAPEAAPVARVSEGLVALYRFDAPAPDGVIEDISESLEPLDLVVNPGATAEVSVVDGAVVFGPSGEPRVPGVFSAWPATALVDAIKGAGKLTLEVWLSSAQERQQGPARIAGISRDSASRNVTLGQEGSRFILRLRTSETDEQGTPELLAPEKSVKPQALQHVVVTFDGYVATFFVDGQYVSETAHFAGTLQNWDPEMHLALGNEVTGDRKWLGKMHLVAFYADALSDKQVAQNFAAGCPTPAEPDE